MAILVMIYMIQNNSHRLVTLAYKTPQLQLTEPHKSVAIDCSWQQIT